jgi:hypothetical protein
MSDYRIESATKEEWANRALSAEAKLAKAVEALRECQEALRDHMKQYPHMAKGYSVDAEKNARTVLAGYWSELNG